MKRLRRCARVGRLALSLGLAGDLPEFQDPSPPIQMRKTNTASHLDIYLHEASTEQFETREDNASGKVRGEAQE